jgi:ubiquinone/menaquinone biosynthesis C-methylase UbiE
MEKLRQILDQYPHATILDVGTGNGPFVYLLASLNDTYDEIVGIDLSEGAIAAAKKNFAENPRIRFEKMDANSLQFPDATFDIVCLSNSLHHLKDIASTLREMERVVKPSGFLLINEMRSDDLNDQQMSHRMLHHFAAEIDRTLGFTHDETYSREHTLDILAAHCPKLVAESWNMEVIDQEPITAEDIEQLCTTVDRQIGRIKDDTQRVMFQSKGNQIKDNIHQHGFAGATQLLIVLRHKN